MRTAVVALLGSFLLVVAKRASVTVEKMQSNVTAVAWEAF